jgi:hypothetical protein
MADTGKNTNQLTMCRIMADSGKNTNQLTRCRIMADTGKNTNQFIRCRIVADTGKNNVFFKIFSDTCKCDVINIKNLYQILIS